jgi:hypothetical protein
MDRFIIKKRKLDDNNESSVAGTSSGSITHSTVRTRAHQGNWQPHRNSNFRDI